MTTTFKPYPKYKPSGVEWLGDIPDHWGIKPMRSLFSFSKGLSITKDDLCDKGIPCVNYGEIHSKYGFRVNPSTNPLKCVREDFLRDSPQALLNEGDFIFADTSEDLAGSGNFTHLEGSSPVFAGYHTVIARPKISHHKLYLAYCLESAAFRSQVQCQVKGIKVFSITQGILKGLICWLPPSSEQTLIANFLDSETAKIDDTIKELEASVELLNEEKTSLINEYITGKINPETGKPYPKYKPSGVQWLGDIPEHWNRSRLGWLFRDSREFGEKGLPFLSISIHTGASDREFSEEEMERKVSRSEDHGKYLRVRPRDLVYNMMRAWQGGIGTIQVDGLVSPAYVVARPIGDVDTAFVETLLRTRFGTSEINRYSKGISDFRKRLYWEDFKAIYIALPPSPESEAISESIKSVVQSCEKLISEKHSLIETLKEYRTSLIHEAVTGKINLRAL